LEIFRLILEVHLSTFLDSVSYDKRWKSDLVWSLIALDFGQRYVGNQSNEVTY